MAVDSPPSAPTPAPRSPNTTADFDADALRERYRQERDKRLRRDGNEQYQEVTGRFRHFTDDPHADPGFQRAPLLEEVDALVIGGGFAGLVAGARLREAGVESLRIIEIAGDFGGTWYWNRYPGAQCDIESYIYLPLLEELGAMPTEKYAHGPEILAHSHAIGAHYDLYRAACFQTRVTGLTWQEATDRWCVETDRGDRFQARFVLMANGPLSKPKLPSIPGIEHFQGHTFHTSRWDYGYTGGDSTGSLDGLADKRVGIVGTGATSVQCVPHLGRSAQQLYVFQRTPSSIDVRGNAPTDPEFVASLEPGWQQRRMDNFNTIVGGGFQEEDLVQDGWTDIFRNLVKMMREESNASALSAEDIALKAELADFAKMEEVRARADQVVEDPATAEALKPYYRQFCKRPCFHDDYLPTFNRPNVQLVDTDGRGVDEITAHGVRVGDTVYEVDCLIFATGFEVGTDYTRRAGYDLIGRGGESLEERWEDGMATFHGFFTRGFPNCFFMMGMQSGLTPNVPHAINEQSQHLAYIVKHALEHGVTTVETSGDAQEDWVRGVHEAAQNASQFQTTCTPGYYNNEGKPDEGDGWFGGMYGEGSEAFFQLLRDWRASGDLPGLELGSRAATAHPDETDAA